ncbi:hypothetical protein BV22DRAFT_455552 [Leucogyrophana mollusca]|uniref:Uncharacterized protein n=1 Tax=Leucogyrophana mollusca TaxID=85980 RepID=A0ACB8BI72_9AGAM|nr:hypothetical protein BV22DRAFT_455552 [Leucogyrophana mollusca]
MLMMCSQLHEDFGAPGPAYALHQAKYRTSNSSAPMSEGHNSPPARSTKSSEVRCCVGYRHRDGGRLHTARLRWCHHRCRDKRVGRAKIYYRQTKAVERRQ